MSFLNDFVKILSRFSIKNKSGLERACTYGVLLLISYALADLSLLSVRPLFLPKKILPPIQKKQKKSPSQSPFYYNSILARNAFNHKGIIPQPLSSKKSLSEEDTSKIVFSKLPLNLLGTIVHTNPKRSVVTISFKKKKEINSYKVGERISQIAEILKIERRKVIFRNLKNNRMEYLEIPDELKIEWLTQSPEKPTPGTGQNKFSFSISKAVFNSYKNNLHTILGQAQVLPVESSSGEVNGFKFAWIKKGSVYEKLGFKSGDVIKEVNGEAVKSPSEGLKLYNELKNSSQVSLLIVRDGREKTFEYQIKD